MTISINTVLEVHTGGSDTNGGGFVTGSTGTDWSQQDAAQYSVTDGVTAGSTTITSATANFGTDVVGNLIYVAGGTGSVTAAWYQIISRTNSTTIVVDRSTGLSVGTGATLHIGGAFATIAAAALVAVTAANTIIFVKAGSGYTLTATCALGTAASGQGSRLIGYTTTRGDGGRVNVTLSTNTGLTAFTFASQWFIENFNIDCGSLGTSSGIVGSSGTPGGAIKNCKVANFTTAGITIVTGRIRSCEVTGGGSGATQAVLSTNGSVMECFLHDNSCPVVITGGGSTITRNLIVNNNVAGVDGVRCRSSDTVTWNVIDNCGRDGVNASSANTPPGIVRNNIISNCNVGLTSATATGAHPDFDGNAYFTNSTNRTNVDSTSGNFNAAPYTNVNDIVLAATPYNNSAGGDWSLNNTTGGGGAVRFKAVPTTITGTSAGTNHLDMGLYQHADPAVNRVVKAASIGTY